MGTDKMLTAFFERIQSDPIIDAGHIAVYMALFNSWVLCGKPDQIRIDRHNIMLLSKISSPTTYFKKLQDLNNRGVINYMPSQKRGVSSFVSIKMEVNGEQQNASLSRSS